jgi:hypothetical protein
MEKIYSYRFLTVILGVLSHTSYINSTAGDESPKLSRSRSVLAGDSERAMDNIRNVDALKRKVVGFMADDRPAIVPTSASEDFFATFTLENLKQYLKSSEPLPDGVFSDLLQKLGVHREGFPPTEKQFAALTEILKNNKPAFVLEGVPGAGKTSSVLVWVVNFIRSFNPSQKVYITAPNEGGQKAIQSDFKSFIDNNSVHFFDIKNNSKIHDLDDNSFLIIDECYIMDRETLSSLMSVAKEKHLTILFTGDSLQNLPSEKSIFGFLKELPSAALTESFRARQSEEQTFAAIVSERFKEPKTRKTAIPSALRYLYNHANRLDKLFKEFSPMIISAHNSFYGIEVTPENLTNDFNAAAQLAASLKAGLIQKDALAKNLMIIVQSDEKDVVKDALLRKNFTETEISSILKTSRESQGAAAENVIILMNKRMTQSEIYVGLTRHKQEVFILIPVDPTGEIANTFIDINDFLVTDFVSDQEKIAAQLNLQSTVLRTTRLMGALKGFSGKSTD